MKSKGLFVITSVYHILLSILLIEEQKLKNNILVIVEITPDIESLSKGLNDSPWFDKVILMEGRKTQKRLTGKLTYALQRHKIVSILDNTNHNLKQLESIIDGYDIYICSPDSAKNYFIYKYKRNNKFMIEDGLKTYVVNKPNNFQVILSKLINRPLSNGFDDRITRVYASEPKKLPKGLHNKGHKLHWKNTLKSLNQSKLNSLTSIFLTDLSTNQGRYFPNDKTKSIIFTQTLNEDGIIESEESKINIYKEFIEHVNTDIIYIKPHPRERTDYAFVFKNDERIKILPKLFPAELLNLLPNLYFNKAFTAFSTAIDNLDNVGEKFQLGLGYFKT